MALTWVWLGMSVTVRRRLCKEFSWHNYWAADCMAKESGLDSVLGIRNVTVPQNIATSHGYHGLSLPSLPPSHGKGTGMLVWVLGSIRSRSQECMELYLRSQIFLFKCARFSCAMWGAQRSEY